MRLDDRVTIATPEGVTLELVLAGLGSRFIARLLDSVIQGAIILALIFGAGIASAPGVVWAGVWVVVFLVMFAYDVPFELLNGGRTIGKMTAGIRVVGRQGEPITFLASATRNIIRIVDFLPAFYAIGVVSIVGTQRDQRLGDLAAGTVVARDKFPGLANMTVAPITVPVEAVATWDVSGLDGQEVATIRHFLDRRLTLAWHVRSYYANVLAQRVGPKVAGAPWGAHPEYFLEGIVVAKQSRG
ncbi:MAG TPA: RDD family protein [Acidimicrobiia bacterium]|nr:RDD family protein [Acidimicrobiia bacterium]